LAPAITPTTFATTTVFAPTPSEPYTTSTSTSREFVKRDPRWVNM
jgi:hypothetical protein